MTRNALALALAVGVTMTMSARAAVACEPQAATEQQAATPAPQHDHAAPQQSTAIGTSAAGNEVDRLLARMNETTGEARVAVMADLIKQLVLERKTAAAPANGAGSQPGSGGTSQAMCPMCASMSGGGAGRGATDMSHCAMKDQK